MCTREDPGEKASRGLCKRTGKRRYDTYAKALRALIELEQRSPKPNGAVGSIYQCTRGCEG
jgi:hypothetical protein